MRCIDADKLEPDTGFDVIRKCYVAVSKRQIDEAPTVESLPIEDVEKLLRSQPYVKVEPYQWIPVKWRELTEEEREHEYGEVPIAMADFLTPDNGDEILITIGGRVEATVYDSSDGYVGDEDWNDWLTDVDAWMPLPKPYKKDDAE